MFAVDAVDSADVCSSIVLMRSRDSKKENAVRYKRNTCLFTCLIRFFRWPCLGRFFLLLLSFCLCCSHHASQSNTAQCTPFERSIHKYHKSKQRIFHFLLLFFSLVSFVTLGTRGAGHVVHEPTQFTAIDVCMNRLSR